MKPFLRPILAALALAACDTWETTNINRELRNQPVDQIEASAVVLSSTAYDPARETKLGDLKVTVNKTTALHPNPTVEQVEAKLRGDAAKMGASRVVETEISAVEISPFSWGTRTGTGIAVKPAN